MPDSWEKIERDEKLVLGYILTLILAMVLGGLIAGVAWIIDLIGG